MRFLPRLTYENYLLHPDAVAAVLRQEDENCAVTAAEVGAWIASQRREAKYYSQDTWHSAPREDWLKVIHAPTFLNDMIAQLTNHKQHFSSNKVRYSLALTEWLIKHDCNFLSELCDYVASLVVKPT